MTTLNLDYDFQRSLKIAKPTELAPHIVHPPTGALGDVSSTPRQIIPPLNTNIEFTAVLPTFKLSEHPGLRDLSQRPLPKNFNWRHNGNKKHLIGGPDNQLLCGSCWAVSTAGVISDLHAVAGTVDYPPNLSSTYNLSTYSQGKCQGGSPAKLFLDIIEGGITTNHCVDYSWCAKDNQCNGKATRHFDEKVNLSDLVPTTGCYDSNVEHLLFSVDTAKVAYIGAGGVSADEHFRIVKTHIHNYGPVQAGFVVLGNFMSGGSTHVNGGVYLENYDYENKRFVDGYAQDGRNVKGGHAVAILGWGIEPDVVVDNQGTKKDVPYWYTRNSWGSGWGTDGGFFKMAMYPFNKVSQFDQIVKIQTPAGLTGNGGIVLATVSKPPKLVKLPQLQQPVNVGRLQPDSYYRTDGRSGSNVTGDTSGNGNGNGGGGKGPDWAKIGMYVGIGVGAFILLVLLYLIFFRERSKGRYGTYRFGN